MAEDILGGSDTDDLGSGRDFGGLRTIRQEARMLAEEGQQREMGSCPVCGSALDYNARGQANCPMGHYRGDADASAWDWQYNR